MQNYNRDLIGLEKKIGATVVNKGLPVFHAVKILIPVAFLSQFIIGIFVLLLKYYAAQTESK